jgi:hypothetical protein
MPFFSEQSRKAAFARMGAMANPKSFHDSYDKFNKKTDKDMYSELDRRLHKSPSELYKKADEDFREGYPVSIKDIAFTEKTIKMRHTPFGLDSLDKFWFEKKSKFSKRSTEAVVDSYLESIPAPKRWSIHSDDLRETMMDKKLKEAIGNKFAAVPSIHLDIDPVKYNVGIVVEEAIRSYDLNKLYYDKYGITKDDIIDIELAKNSFLNQASNVSIGQAA